MTKPQAEIQVLVNNITNKAMLDCGATCNIISKRLAKKLKLKPQKEATKVKVVDRNSMVNFGKVALTLSIEGYTEMVIANVLAIPDIDIILGIPWFYDHQPGGDWKTYVEASFEGIRQKILVIPRKKTNMIAIITISQIKRII